MAYRGIDYLRTKLELKKTRVDLRYIFYEQKQRALDFGISTPEGFEYFNSVNGWCSKAVDALADRLQFDGFDNDNFNMMDIYSANNPDVLFDSAVLSSMIASCSFQYRCFLLALIMSGNRSLNTFLSPAVSGFLLRPYTLLRLII